MSDAPDISEVYRFPVGDMSWGTMSKIIEDLVSSSTSGVHGAVYHGYDLNGAQDKACANILMAYNYLERWLDAHREKLDGEPF